MKNIFKSLTVILLIYSCRQDVLKYSCDPVLNEMVTTHMQEYVNYTVNNLTTFDLPAQQAIFRTYTPEKKREIWLEKIQFLLENENYLSEEYLHVIKLLDLLNVGSFNPETVKVEALQRAQFTASWVSYAKIYLGWTDRYIAFVVYRLYTQQSQFDAEIKAIRSLQRQATSESENGECNCSSNFFCGYATICNENNQCQPTSFGCGLLWKENCTGQCLGS